MTPETPDTGEAPCAALYRSLELRLERLETSARAQGAALVGLQGFVLDAVEAPPKEAEELEPLAAAEC